MTLEAKNGGALALDFVTVSNDIVPRKTAPIVIILPGLVGDSQCIYTMSAAEKLAMADDMGYASYRVVIVNSRGSMSIDLLLWPSRFNARSITGIGNPLTSPHLTHAGSTEDVKT